MSANTVLATMARGLALAGFSFLLIAWGGVAPGGEATSLNETRFRGLDGERIELTAPAGGASVLIFYSTECPISNCYSPTLASSMGEFRRQPVELGRDLRRSRPERRRGPEPRPRFQADVSGSLATVAARLPASSARPVTPEAFVIDAEGKVRYHGRIDDQFVARRVRNAKPGGSELKDAIVAVLHGKDVAVALRRGRRLPDPRGPLSRPANPTYYQGRRRRSSRRTARSATARARSVRSPSRPTSRRGNARRTSPRSSRIARCRRGRRRRMSASSSRTTARSPTRISPRSSPGPKPAHPRETARPAAASQIPRRLAARHARPGRRHRRGFRRPGVGRRYLPLLRRADQRSTRISTSRRSSTGPATAASSTTSWPMWTSRARPGSAIAADPGPGYSCFGGPGEPIHGDLGGWAPGIQPSPLPDGIGRSLPRGRDIIIQVHYHPSGKPETDRTRIGLHFARSRSGRPCTGPPPLNPEWSSRPGSPTSRSRPPGRVPVDLVAHAVTPHMHLLGRDMPCRSSSPTAGCRT